MTIDHAITKPTVFISHASSDAEFANAVKVEIEKVFANGVNVFCTSSPGIIPAGTDWLASIEDKLRSSQAVIAIVTPVSIERPWMWFELGATWHGSRSGECRIYPLCAPEVELGNLPSPLDRLQALSMGRAIDLKLLFESLAQQFGFGNLSTFRASNITKRIPKYKNVKIADIDRNEARFYSGRYTGYTDPELMEVIDSYLFRPDANKEYEQKHGKPESIIHKGKLLHFREIDRSLDLPPGTARRLMNEVASRYELAPVLEDANIVRYGPSPRSSA